MKTCKTRLHAEEIEKKNKKMDAFFDMYAQLNSIEDEGVINIPNIISVRLPFPGIGDEMEVTREKAPKIEKNINKEIAKIIKKINELEADDACSCPTDTEFLSIDSKDSSKSMRVGSASLVTLPIAAFTLGLSVLPYSASKAVYLNKKDHFRDCIGKFDNVKKVEANWTGLINLDNVAKMDNLEELIVNRNLIDNIEGIRGAKNLKKFNMNNNYTLEKTVVEEGKEKIVPTGPVDLMPLSTIENLEEVSVMGSSVKNVGSLAKLRGLKRLNVSMTGTSLDEIKDVIINNENLEFLNMMFSDIPQLTCQGTTFKTMRVNKKDKIDKLRSCLKDDTLKIDPFQKSVTGKFSRFMKNWFGSGALQEMIENNAMEKWYSDEEECDGKINVKTKVTKLSRGMEIDGEWTTYGVVNATVKHDTDCTEKVTWSKPEKTTMCVKFSDGATIVPMEECNEHMA